VYNTWVVKGLLGDGVSNKVDGGVIRRSWRWKECEFFQMKHCSLDAESPIAHVEQIRSLANRIAQEISPQRIILFGSHAHGRAGPDSDVDLLVVTDRPTGSDASLDLRRKVEYSFPLDLILCDAGRLAQRIEAGDFFLQDAVQFGKVLYERSDR
jgi:predicted nucleotidyltransferase